MKNVVGFVGGIIFSIGLIISGMINPNVVIGFLDLFRDWDYALAFVMGGAVIVNIIAFPLIMKREPVCHDSHALPSSNTNITASLVIGSALFGLGWGLVGICPGPGIVNLVTLKSEAFLFVGAMIVGMAVYKKVFE